MPNTELDFGHKGRGRPWKGGEGGAGRRPLVGANSGGVAMTERLELDKEHWLTNRRMGVMTAAHRRWWVVMVLS